MNILVDENIPNMTVLALREGGHDVLDVRGTPHEGSTDDAIWRIATEQRRLLITTDKGFVQKREESHSGILVVRLKRPTAIEIHRRILLALAQIPQADWPGLVLVMRDVAQSMWRAGERL